MGVTSKLIAINIYPYGNAENDTNNIIVNPILANILKIFFLFLLNSI